MQAEKEIIKISPSFLKGGGEMGELIRGYNWSSTSLGGSDGWSQSLRTALSLILNAPLPMLLFWGPDLLCFYNDAYRSNLGLLGQHPSALGKNGDEVLPEIKQLITKAQINGESCWREDHLIPVYRKGKVEDVYWTFCYSTVYDESETVAGIFVTCNETAMNPAANKHDLSLAMEIAELGTYKLILATNKVTLSDRIMNWFGFKDPNVDLNRLKSILHPNDMYRTAKFINDTTKSEEASRHNIQYTVIDPRTGEERHLRSIGKTFFNEKNIPVSIEGVLQDITQQVNVLKKIELSEQRFRNLIRHATVGVIILIGPEMIVDIVNEFYCHVINKTYKELIGKPLFDVAPEMDDYFRKRLNRVRITGIPMYLYEHPIFVMKDGKKKECYVNLVYQPLKEKNDEISGVVVLVHDVTEQVMSRQGVEYAEQRARLVIDTAGLGVYEVNLMTDEIMPDAIFNKIFGFDHTVTKAEFLSIIHPEDVHIRNSAHDVSVITGHLEYECRLLWRDNTIHWMRVKGKVFYDDNHVAVRLLGVAQNITDQKLVSEDLERKVAARTKDLAEANHQLHKTNTELNQFAYIASHDLQEPLRKITTYTGMLESSMVEMNEVARNYIKKIENSSNRMKALINDVLVFSQLEEDSRSFLLTDLNKILEDVKEDYEIVIAQKKAVITSNVLPVIEALPLQMSQLMANLMSNALKFNKTDTIPLINIFGNPASQEQLESFPELDPQLDYYHIQFKDNGIGFSTEYAEKIFAIFQRLHNKKHFDGTGIGLAICRKIALIHKGYINAASEQNCGAVFNIILPMRQSSKTA